MLPDKAGEWSAVALDLGFERKTLARRHDRDPVTTKIAIDEYLVAGLDAIRAMTSEWSITPMPVVLMKTPSPFRRSTTFVLTGDESHPGKICRLAHRADDPFELGDRQPLLEDEPDAEIGGRVRRTSPDR
jgi:hypothetical protein